VTQCTRTHLPNSAGRGCHMSLPSDRPHSVHYVPVTSSEYVPWSEVAPLERIKIEYMLDSGLMKKEGWAVNYAV